MFDILTETERHALASKLADWAHNLAVIGHTLASVALANVPPEGPHGADPAIWALAERYYDTRADFCTLRRDVLAA